MEFISGNAYFIVAAVVALAAILYASVSVVHFEGEDMEEFLGLLPLILLMGFFVGLLWLPLLVFYFSGFLLYAFGKSFRFFGENK